MLLILFDAFDEARNAVNLIKSNELSHYNFKIVITSRPEYLKSLHDYEQLFRGYESEDLLEQCLIPELNQ